jgi:hypothetical protein
MYDNCHRTCFIYYHPLRAAEFEHHRFQLEMEEEVGMESSIGVGLEGRKYPRDTLDI